MLDHGWDHIEVLSVQSLNDDHICLYLSSSPDPSISYAPRKPDLNVTVHRGDVRTNNSYRRDAEGTEENFPGQNLRA